MTIEIITYHVATGNPKPGLEWTAYIVLPTGDFWHVRFNGPTEEIAKEKAISRWAKENAKWDRLGLNKAPDEDKSEPGMPGYFDSVLATAKLDDPWANKAAPIGRGHHFAGKVWMRNADGLKRVALTEIALYEKNGYHRSSPRGK